MVVKEVSALKEWDKNPRSIDKASFERLKEQLKLGQHSTLLITSDGIVLGGNMRLKAMRDLQIPTAKCIVLDFKETESGIIPVIDGEEVKDKVFKTKEDAMMEYSLSHNDRAGYYDMDAFENIKDNFNVDWSKFSVDISVPKTIPELEKFLLDGGELDEDYSQNVGEVVYEPKETGHKVSDLYQAEHKFDQEIEQIENSELKEMFKARVAYFSNFDFAKIADYYAYQATPEEQKIMEKLALVLLDKDQLIENGFSKIKDLIAGKKDEKQT